MLTKEQRDQLRSKNTIVPKHQLLDDLDAKDKEIADLKDDYLRRHNDAVDRLEEIITLKAELIAANEHIEKLKVDRDKAVYLAEKVAELERLHESANDRITALEREIDGAISRRAQ